MPIDSPCRASCQLNNENICVGCHRTIDEIVNWNLFSDLEKQNIADALPERKRYFEDQLISKQNCEEPIKTIASEQTKTTQEDILRPITSKEYRQFKRKK